MRKRYSSLTNGFAHDRIRLRFPQLLIINYNSAFANDSVVLFRPLRKFLFGVQSFTQSYVEATAAYKLSQKRVARDKTFVLYRLEIFEIFDKSVRNDELRFGVHDFF